MAVTVNGSTGVSLVQDNVIVLADLTATGTASATTFLRGDNAWATPAAGGGLTLLSTLTTTSGTSHTTAALDLSTYKTLQIYMYSIGNTSGSQNLQFTPNGGSVSTPYVGGPSSVQAYYLDFSLDLSTGVYGYAVNRNGARNLTSGDGGGIGGGGANTGLTTSTTSIMFAWSGGATFDLGTIKIYGLK